MTASSDARYTDEQMAAARAAAELIADNKIEFHGDRITKVVDGEPVRTCDGALWVGNPIVDGDISTKRVRFEAPEDESLDTVFALREVASLASETTGLDLDGYFDWRGEHRPAKPSQVIADFEMGQDSQVFLDACLCNICGKEVLSELAATLSEMPELVARLASEDLGKTRISEEAIREKVWQLGIFNKDHVACSMALDYAKEYLRLEKQVAASFDVVSGGAGTWKALPASERSDYLMQAACEHALADWDLLDDKFASRMDDSIADMGRKHEELLADRAEAAAECASLKGGFEASLDDAEARAEAESQRIGKDEARADRIER